MEPKDPFIEGLRAIFKARPELKPSAVSVKAGLDDSTIRKLLSGQNSSPKITTARQIADAIGIQLTAIIAIGSQDRTILLLDIIEKSETLPDEALDELSQFVDFLRAKHSPRTKEIKDSALAAIRRNMATLPMTKKASGN